jgi:hypothetical protein
MTGTGFRMPGFHEDLHREVVHKANSDRSFGLWFAAIGEVVGLWPLMRRAPIQGWALIAGAAFPVSARSGRASCIRRIWLEPGLASCSARSSTRW